MRCVVPITVKDNRWLDYLQRSAGLNWQIC
jgi:hypothetical protein